MCGIAACADKKDASRFVLTALKRLQYRGYDSWGILGSHGGQYMRTRRIGQIDENQLSTFYDICNTAIGHTRWATHGEVSEKNAHPISATPHPSNVVWVVHNGVIENHEVLRCQLETPEYPFRSETDTEVIAALLANRYYFSSLEDHGRMACDVLEGQFAFAAYLSKFPGTVLLAARGSPLYVSDAGYAASDLNALAGFGKRAARLQDDQVVLLTPTGVSTLLDYCEVIPASADEKPSGHRMLAEIRQQPELLRYYHEKSTKISPENNRLTQFRLFGCGSSYNAALLGRHYLEAFAGVPAFVDYATEIPVISLYDPPGTVWIGLTQSGETKDTLNALEFLKRNVGSDRLFVLTNNPLSSAARLAKPINLWCGPEYGVAATKTFTIQAARLLEIASAYSIFGFAADTLGKELPAAVEKLLTNDISILEAAQYVTAWHNILYLARGILYPVAMEGALKMKEVAYVHAEAMHAAEMKHGPLAIIDDHTLSIFLLTHQDEKHIARVLTNMQEVKARKGKILVFADEHTQDAVRNVADRVVFVPSVHPFTQPILVTVALQLLSYYVAVFKGLNVDMPRNLAKCCTVE